MNTNLIEERKLDMKNKRKQQLKELKTNLSEKIEDETITIPKQSYEIIYIVDPYVYTTIHEK